MVRQCVPVYKITEVLHQIVGRNVSSVLSVHQMEHVLTQNVLTLAWDSVGTMPIVLLLIIVQFVLAEMVLRVIHSVDVIN